MKQTWRPWCFWACCSWDNEQVPAVIKAVNKGCAPGKEVIRPATIKEYGNLTIEEIAALNEWLVKQESLTFKAFQAKLDSLRHRRWAIWHLRGSDNPNVHPDNSMLLSVLVL